jgi:translation elongation factor EF-G
VKSKNFICIISEGHDFYSEEKFRYFSIIKTIFLPIGRYNIKIPRAYSGFLVFLEGIEKFIKKSAIFYDWKNISIEFEEIFISILREFSFFGFFSTLIFYIQPSFPHQLKNLLKSLRKCLKIYPSFFSKIESTGELTLMTTGKLFFDCILHDLNNVYGNFDVKISEPFAQFFETIGENKKSSFIISKKINIEIEKLTKNFRTTNEQKNCEIMFIMNKFPGFFGKEMKKKLKSGFINKKIEKYLYYKKTEANSLWSFGSYFQNYHICEFFFSSKNKMFTQIQKKNLINNFNYATKEGPLNKGPMNELRFRLNVDCKSPLNYFNNLRMINKIRKIFNWLVFKNNPKIQSPFFLGELIFPLINYHETLNLIKIHNGVILSVRSLLDKKILILRILISLLNVISLQNDLEIFKKKNIVTFFYFDKWKTNFENLDQEFIKILKKKKNSYSH